MILVAFLASTFAACNGARSTGTTDTARVSDSTTVVDTTKKDTGKMKMDTSKKDTVKKP